MKKYIRSLESHEAYKVHVKNALESFDDMSEYITTMVFASKYQSFVMNKNAFPYTYSKHHYVLWRNPLYDRCFVYEMSPVFQNVYLKDAVFFENEEPLKSIKGLTHYHVLSDEIIDFRNVFALVF